MTAPHYLSPAPTLAPAFSWPVYFTNTAKKIDVFYVQAASAAERNQDDCLVSFSYENQSIQDTHYMKSSSEISLILEVAVIAACKPNWACASSVAVSAMSAST